MIDVGVPFRDCLIKELVDLIGLKERLLVDDVVELLNIGKIAFIKIIFDPVSSTLFFTEIFIGTYASKFNLFCQADVYMYYYKVRLGS